MNRAAIERRAAHVNAAERQQLMGAFHQAIERITDQHPDRSGFTDAVYAFLAFELEIPKRVCHARQLSDSQLKRAIRLMKLKSSRDVSDYLVGMRTRKRRVRS